MASSSDADNDAYMQLFEQAFSSLSTQQHAGQVYTSMPPTAAISTGLKKKAPPEENKRSRAAGSGSSMLARRSSSSAPGRSAAAATSACSRSKQLQAAQNTGSSGHPAALQVDGNVGDITAEHAATAHTITPAAAASKTAAHHAACHAAAAVAPGWRAGPVDEAGVLVQLSERPIMCSAANWVGNEVVVGSSDHALYAVDLRSGKKRRTLYSKTSGHTEWVTCVCYLPGGRVLSGGMDGRLWLWPTGGAAGTELQAAHAAPVSKVACLTPVAAGAAGAAGKTSRGSAAAAAAAAAGPVLAASCSYDETVKVWDVSSSRGKQVAELRGHAGPVLEMDVDQAGEAIVTGDRKGHLMCWDLSSGSSSWGVANAHQGHITALAWQLQQDSSSSNGSVALSGGQDGYVRVWDGRIGSCVAEQAVHVDQGGKGAVGSIVPVSSSNSGHVVTAGADMTLKVLDPAMSYRPIHSIRLTDFPYALSGIGGLAVCGCGDGSVHVVDVVAGKSLYAVGAGKAAIRAIEVSAGRLVCAGDDGYLMLYDFV